MARTNNNIDGVQYREDVYYFNINDIAPLIVGSGSINAVVPIVSASVSVVVNSGAIANVTMTPQTHFYGVDATAANIGVVLPDAALATGRTYTVKKLDVSANLVHLSGAGTNKIWSTGSNPTPILNLKAQGQAYTVISDGTTWHVVGFFSGTGVL